MDLRDRLNLEHPIAQAGLGGGLARGELAGAVSNAGGLGTIGIMPPAPFAAEINKARKLAPGRPLAANLLLPFTKPAHVRACIDAGVDAVVLFFGFAPHIVQELRQAQIFVIHQVGDPAQAKRAFADGADAVIAQGLEAGGHLLATQPLDEFLTSTLEIANGRPVLAAGGIVDEARVREVLDAGAAAAVCGTRFLLTEECHAHPDYQQRVIAAQETIDTQLFGFG
jgi:nitronate monooxygenase